MLDGFPNQLTGSVKHLCLLDTAFCVNSSYPPILRPERKADLIIHLNYCAGSQTKASSAKKGSRPTPHRLLDLASEKLKPLSLMEVRCPDLRGVARWPSRNGFTRFTELIPILFLHLSISHIWQFFSCKEKKSLKSNLRASLVAQWLRTHLPTQGTRVRALVQEEPTCRGATKPVCYNYRACALEPASHNC